MSTQTLAVEASSPAQNQEGDDRCVSPACVNGYHGDCADIDGNCCDCDCHLNLSAPRHSTVDDLPLSPGYGQTTFHDLYELSYRARQVLCAARNHVDSDRAADEVLTKEIWTLLEFSHYTCSLRFADPGAVSQ